MTNKTIFDYSPISHFSARKLSGFSMIVPSYEKRVPIINTFLNFTFFDPPKSLVELISWGSNESQKIEEIVQNYSQIAQKSNILLKYSIHDDKSLSRRFLDADNIQTSTILTIDDDILMPSENIEYGFKIWQKHPTQLVGYLARYLGIQKANITGQRDILKYEVPGSFDRIRLVLTNIAFFSRHLALSFYKQSNRENVEIVQKFNNCEDILMNFVAMNESNLSAVFVLRHYSHIGVDGLSTTHRNTHFLKRDVCVNKFYESFGRYPPIVPSDCRYL